MFLKSVGYIIKAMTIKIIKSEAFPKSPAGFYIVNDKFSSYIHLYRNFNFTPTMKLLALYSSIILLTGDKRCMGSIDFRADGYPRNHHHKHSYLLPCGRVIFYKWK